MPIMGGRAWKPWQRDRDRDTTAGFPGTRRMGIEKTYFFSRDLVNLALENCMKPIISPGHMGSNNEISNNVIWICARIVYVRWGK